MSVTNGEYANQTTFNDSFMSREGDTNTLGKVDLENVAAASGSSVFNIQRVLNSLASALGITTGEVYNFLITWASDDVGSANDTVQARIEAIVAAFHASTGHAHTGATGDGPQISADDLIDLNKYFAEFQSVNVTGASGTSSTITTEMSGKTSGGGVSTAGVVTSAPYNKCHIVDSSNGTAIEDAEGQRVYGRITESGGVWTLTFYTNESGVETSHSLSSTNIKVIYCEVFTQDLRPTFGSAVLFDIGSLDLTADVVDASASQRGVVSTGAQTFSGAKTFADGIKTDTIDEETPAAGVTIDSVLIKDGLVDGRDVSADGSTLTSHVANTSNPHSVTASQVGLGNVTNHSQLKRADGDFDTFTEKTAPVSDDIVLIEDSAASYAKKKLKLSNMIGGGGGINFVTAGTGDSTTGWTTYADAAATRPADGTGGSPNVTWTTSSSSPLYGTNSFIFTKDAANRQGEGVAYAFSVSPAHFAKSSKISFDYIVGSGTFSAGSSSSDSDVIVYIYDVTNSQLIEPSNIKLFSNSSTIADKFEATFQTSATGTSYRLIFHCASTSASAYTLKIDNVSISPNQAVYGTPVTDWVSYTPTVTFNSGGATNVTWSGRWRREGDSLEINVAGYFSGASAAFNTPVISLPSGLSIDTSKIPASVDASMNMGTGIALDNGSQIYDIFVRYANTTTVSLQVKSASSTYVQGAGITEAIPFTWGNTDYLSFNARIPIQGWSSNTRISDGYDGRVIAFTGGRSSIQTIAHATTTTVELNSISTDTIGAWDSGTYRYYIKSSDYYELAGKILYNPSGSAGPVFATVRVDGTEVASGTSNIGTATKAEAVTAPVVKYLTAGQYVELTSYNFTGGNLDIEANAAYTYLTVKKAQGSQTISAGEVVAANYTGAPPTGSLGASWYLATFGTKVNDTHGAYSGGVYTIPVSGFYDIGAEVLVDATYSAGNILAVGIDIDSTGTPLYAKQTKADAATTGTLNASVDVKGLYLKAGQTVKTLTWTNGSGASFDTSSAYNFFSIAKR